VVRGGQVECWGANAYGQLGDGATASSSVPVLVSGIAAGATAVTAGNLFTCALVSGGVQCWGYGFYGQLGDDATDASTGPVPVGGMTSGVTAACAGGATACGVRADGSVWCWGMNQSGQLGNGDPTNTDSPVPVQASGVSGATLLGAGTAHVCAVASGGVQCWGWNVSGQLGDGTQDDRASPVTVQGF
jgi:alpha-tubulin suppressor-like RCC1 family protein